MRYLFFLAMVVLFCASNAGADCKSDCQDTYDTAVSDCQSEYDGPYDTNQRQNCIDEAKADYESCIEQCEELDNAEE